jgi:hypothetical protein
VSQRRAFTGSSLIRELSRLTDAADPPLSRQSFAERLSHWLGWTDAISLSSALRGAPVDASTGSHAGAVAEQAQYARVREAQTHAIAQEMRGVSRDAANDFPPYRRRYVARQQAMESSIGPLRGRLRETLAARSPAMARLAAVDAVMEQVVGPHESRLLSTVPALLEQHFKRSRAVEAAADTTHANDSNDINDINHTNMTDDGEARRAAWLNAFGQDMQSVLLAELDLRLQPVEGLLEALRAS